MYYNLNTLWATVKERLKCDNLEIKIHQVVDGAVCEIYCSNKFVATSRLRFVNKLETDDMGNIKICAYLTDLSFSPIQICVGEK